MAKITANGLYNGVKTKITVETVKDKLVILVNGFTEKHTEKRLLEASKEPPALGGTYYPESGSILAVYSVLYLNYFDKIPTITIEGNIDIIPCLKDVVY